MSRSAHPPPETTSITLILKLMAMLKQVGCKPIDNSTIDFCRSSIKNDNRWILLQELQKFSQGVQSDNHEFYHKLLRKEFEVCR
jgi:hypothetical protein